MMLALSVGLMLILVTVALFRATSKAIIRSNRIATQNQLLIAGISYALDDLDGWDTLNDPADPTNPTKRPRLFVAAPVNDGRPFNWLKPSYPVGAFRASDPKWWYGYRFVTAARERVPGGALAPQLPQWVQFGSRGDPVADRAFLHRWPYYLFEQLGMYGMIDYMPPGVPIGLADMSSRTVNAVAIWEPSWLYPFELISDTTGYTNLVPSEYPMTGSLGREQSVVIVSNDLGSGATPVTQLYNRKVYYASNRNSTLTNKNALYRFFTADVAPVRILPADAPSSMASSAPVGPVDWPQLEVASYRLIRRGVHHNLAVIRLQDPMTGEMLATTVSAVSTTLRGARIERGLDVLP
ncbi:MAG: hypothetical protein J0M02_00230 [Planctomycetes bacterium]|nr:hypothetical protein [Planctomycetota bacterium]